MLKSVAIGAKFLILNQTSRNYILPCSNSDILKDSESFVTCYYFLNRGLPCSNCTVTTQYNTRNLICREHLNTRFQRDCSVLLPLMFVMLVKVLISVMSTMVLMPVISVLLLITYAYNMLTLAILTTAKCHIMKVEIFN